MPKSASKNPVRRAFAMITLAGLTLATAITVVISILDVIGVSNAETWIGLIVSILVFCIDCIWLIYFGLNHHNERQNITLLQNYPVIAWLIYHTAALPIIIFVEHLVGLKTASIIMIHLALMIMGFLPIGLMFWLNRYLKKRLG